MKSPYSKTNPPDRNSKVLDYDTEIPQIVKDGYDIDNEKKKKAPMEMSCMHEELSIDALVPKEDRSEEDKKDAVLNLIKSVLALL